ncbi:MAG: hypothetical protein ABI835_20455 [Chloroflexota bacterium]
MQHLNTLSQLVNAASSVMELARSSQTYSFGVSSGATCYVHVSGGEVRVARHNTPLVEIVSQLQAPFGWRIAAQQDAAGVYFVALRRAIIGGMANATFLVTVPQDAHLVLKLEHARLSLENVDGVLELSPQTVNLSIVAK